MAWISPQDAMIAATSPRHAVVMACDDGYLPYALTLAASIRRWQPEGGFDIVLAAEEPLDLPTGVKGLDIRTKVLGRNPFRGDGPGDRHGSATFLRLLVPDALEGDYERVLFLDSDMLCAGSGIDRLLGAEMGSAWLGAVRDNTQWRTPGRHLPEFRAMSRPARAYFNAGALLIDVAAWREAEVLARALDLFRTRPDAILRHDQSLLNLLADGAWAEMSPVWNWQYTWSSRFFADLAEPRVVHFIGPRKPWSPGGADLPLRFRQPFAEMLEAHFPGRPLPDPRALAWPDNLRRSFLKHWTAAAAMDRYLRRFPDPFRLVPAG